MGYTCTTTSSARALTPVPGLTNSTILDSGRDVFEFLAQSTKIRLYSCVLEIGGGTLRVGLHFIRYLNPDHYHCFERDELSLMAAFRYELLSQGLLYKRPLIVKGDDMDFSKFGSGVMYDLIYASAVFLHMPDKLV
ncbi:hypothetical protein E2542_SST11273 [Spatholobus suberectus]|nr:hypothetical protein E2542_SST11273 [Spatholobus suberectus]